MRHTAGPTMAVTATATRSMQLTSKNTKVKKAAVATSGGVRRGSTRAGTVT
ncbi:hypothetical protein [Streptomyces canus]|uniref:hypothetical protein n=1 Tax=Streptomyces canus TaxID=58343 RepID=UPI0027D7D20D|nr:hypothetical protein [Streptomyces canus]